MRGSGCRLGSLSFAAVTPQHVSPTWLEVVQGTHVLWLQPRVERRCLWQTQGEGVRCGRGLRVSGQKRRQVLEHRAPGLQGEPGAGTEIPEGSLHGSDFPGW